MKRTDLIEGEVYAWAEYGAGRRGINSTGARPVVFSTIDSDSDLVCYRAEIDKDGTVTIGDTRVYPPARDLVGSWAEYLGVHGKRLALASWTEAANKAQNTVRNALDIRINDLFGISGSHVSRPSERRVLALRESSVCLPLDRLVALMTATPDTASAREASDLLEALDIFAKSGPYKARVSALYNEGVITPAMLPEIPHLWSIAADEALTALGSAT